MPQAIEVQVKMIRIATSRLVMVTPDLKTTFSLTPVLVFDF
jgi:hypothetical protein